MIRQGSELLIATTNVGKFRELSAAFADVPLRLKSLLDFEAIGEVEETGSTFEENAVLKASGYAEQTGVLTLADDSGLEIAALRGAPGVLSARFGGDVKSYEDKIRLILEDLQKAGTSDRRARFLCVMALAAPDGEILAIGEGICSGMIRTEPRGRGGFGYDPVFIPDGFDESFGELPDAIKQQISHRARAAQIIIRYLLDKIAI